MNVVLPDVITIFVRVRLLPVATILPANAIVLLAMVVMRVEIVRPKLLIGMLGHTVVLDQIRGVLVIPV